MAITAAMRTSVTELYVSLFGRAPERDGLAFWVGKLDAGATYAQIAQQMFDVEPARAYYPASSTREELVAKFYTNVLGRTGDAESVKFWTGKFDAAGKVTVGEVFAQIIAAVKGYAGTDQAGLDSKALFLNKVAVGEYYGFTLNSNDIAGATAIMANVTKDPASVDVAKGGQGNNPVLTNNTDKVSGVNFISEQVYTPDGSKRINSLQDEDQLTGTQTGATAKNTLTATLGNANDNGGTVITPKLTNVQIVNVAFTGSASGGANSAVTGLDLQDATFGTTPENISQVNKEVNITRVASATGTNNARVENIKAALNTMSIASTNANQAGTVEFSFGKDVLLGDNKGALNLTDVQVGTVNIGENFSTSSTFVQNASYEQLTINSAAQANTVGTLNLPMDTGSAGSITITGDKALTLAQTTNVVNTTGTGAQTIESVTFSGGLTGVNGRLATLTADGMTAGGVKLNLDAGFFTTGKADTSGVVQNVSVTGSKFDDTFYLGGKIQSGDKLDGGAGTDKLVIYNSGDLVAGKTTNTTANQSSAIAGIETLEVRLNSGGASIVGMDKLADVKTIALRNEGATAGVPTAKTAYFGLYELSVDQANAVTIHHGNSLSNDLLQNTVDLYSTTATAFTVTIAEGVNTDPRFNFILDTNDGTSVALKDADTESNTVALVRPGNITSKVTLSGGLAGTYLNLDTTTTGTGSVAKAAVAASGSTPALPAIAANANAAGGLTNLSTFGSASAATISGAQDLSLAVGQVKIVAATFDAKDELANVTARFSTNAASTVGAQTITMGAGSDTVIFDNITDSRAGLTGADLVDGGAGTDILAIDGDMAYNTTAGSVIALGASEWTGVKNFEQIKLISAGNTTANNGSTGASGFAVANKTSTTYELTLTDTLIANNSNGGTTVLSIVNNNNSGNVSYDGGATVNPDNGASAWESSVTIDARSLGNASRFNYTGEDGDSRTNDRIIFSDVNFNGTHSLNGGAVTLKNTNAADGNLTSGGQLANLDVLEFRNTVNASAADFNGVRNFGVIELTNDTSTTQVSTVELTDTIVGNLVSTSQSTLAETLTIRGFDSTTVALATTGLQLQAGSLGNLSNLNINLFNAGGINNIITGAGVDNVILSRVGTSAANATKDTLTLGAGNDTVTILGNFAAANTQYGNVADATGIITSVSALANGTNAFGVDGIAGNGDDAAGQLSYSDVINFGAGANTLYTYGAVNLTQATISTDAGAGNSYSIVANSNLSIGEAQLANLIAAGGTLTFAGSGNHSLTIVNDPAINLTIDLSKVIVTGTGTLAVATGGITTNNSVIAPVGTTVTVNNTLTVATPDTTVPVFSSAAVVGNVLTMTYNEALLGSSDPAVGQFTVLVGGVANVVTAADANGSTVTLTLTTAVAPGAAVTVAYAVPATNPIKDAAGNSAAALPATIVAVNTVGNNISLTATAAVVNATTATNASAFTTAAADTITSTLANVNGATTLTGLDGVDTLTVTDAGTLTIPAGVTTVEKLVLANGTNSVSFGAVGFNGITGGTGTDSINVTNLSAGGAVSLGDANDALTAMTVAIATGASSTFVGGAGTDSVTFATGQTITAGTLANFSTIETVDFGQVAAASAATLVNGLTSLTHSGAAVGGFAMAYTGTNAAYSTLTSITQTATDNAADTIGLTVSDAATIDFSTKTIGNNARDFTLSLGNFANNVTLTAAQYNNTGSAGFTTITGNAGADTLSFTGAGTFTATATTGGNTIENMTAVGTAAVNIDDTTNAAIARTYTGNSGANVFTLAEVTAAKTVALATGGSDTVKLDAAGLGNTAVTISGFQGGLTASGGDILSLSYTAATAGFALNTNNTGSLIAHGAAAAGNIINVVALSNAVFQVSGAFTDAAVKNALVNGVTNGFVALAHTTADFYYVALDNGTDSAIYRIQLTNAGGSAGLLDSIADVTAIQQVVVLTGVTDVAALTASNFA